MTTTNMSLNEPSVGQTAGPDWATEVNANFTTIDQHDHTSGKGVQLTPSALNINSDLEFNGNAAIELKRLTLDSSATGSGTNYSVYQSGGNLYWYNGSGQAVQITNGANVKTTGGSIDGMSGTDAQVLYGSGIYRFEFDTTLSPFSGAKMAHGDILLYKYDGSSGSDAYVILKYTGSSAGSNNITVPDETGTMLTTSTSYGGNISIAATGGSNTITLDAEGDINLDSNSGVLTFKDNGTAIGKISNSSSDLVIENEVDAKDTIFKQYDGNEVVRMADDRRLYFFDKGGEYIVGDGTDLTVASGGAINLTATTDVVVPANVGVTFGTGEKIEGDNTDLTLTSGADINLTATADVNLPNNVGLVFGDDGEKIEGDGTDLTIASSGEININSGTLDLSAQTVDVTLNNAVDALNFDSNTLSIDAQNNRVGIGTAAPSTSLVIKRSSAGSSLLLDTASGTNASYIEISGEGSGIGFLGGGSGLGASATDFVLRGTNNIKFNIGIDTKATLDSSGNVGIGKTPAARLDVKSKADNANDGGISIEAYSNTNRLFQLGETTSQTAIQQMYSGNTEKVRLHANGDTYFNGGSVGIGTTSPNFLTHGGPVLSILGGSTNNNAVIELANPNAGSGDGLGQVEFLNFDGGSTVTARAIIVGGHGGADDASELRFYTESSGSAVSENMRILPGGQIRIKCANMAANPSSSNVGVFIGNTSTGSSFFGGGTGTETHMIFGNANGVVGTIQTSSSSTAFNTSSDYRLKENVTPLTGAIERLNQLKPSRFNFIKDPDTTMDGFLAHEVSDYVPEAVSGEKDQVDEDGEIKPQGIDQSKLVPLIVASIQELSAKVTALEGA